MPCYDSICLYFVELQYKSNNEEIYIPKSKGKTYKRNCLYLLRHRHQPMRTVQCIASTNKNRAQYRHQPIRTVQCARYSHPPIRTAQANINQ